MAGRAGTTVCGCEPRTHHSSLLRFTLSSVSLNFSPVHLFLGCGRRIGGVCVCGDRSVSGRARALLFFSPFPQMSLCVHEEEGNAGGSARRQNKERRQNDGPRKHMRAHAHQQNMPQVKGSVLAYMLAHATLLLSSAAVVFPSSLLTPPSSSGHVRMLQRLRFTSAHRHLHPRPVTELNGKAKHFLSFFLFLSPCAASLFDVCVSAYECVCAVFRGLALLSAPVCAHYCRLQQLASSSHHASRSLSLSSRFSLYLDYLIRALSCLGFFLR